MFFDDLSQLANLAVQSGCAIFVVPNETEIELKNAMIVEPQKGYASIKVGQIREIIQLTNTQQSEDRFFVVRPADKMTEEAENAFLKLLEEPGENYHFVLITERPDLLLPTVLSRAKMFYWRKSRKLTEPPRAKREVLDLAKRILVAKASDLIEISELLNRKKDEKRKFTLEVLAVAIELAYKSYFMTNKLQFLRKIPKLVKTYEAIAQNGNLRLHLVADLC